MHLRGNVFRGLAVGAVLAFGLAACEDTVVNVPEPVAPEREPTVVVSPSSVELNVGESQQFVATVTGTDNRQVTWRSSNTEAVTVTDAGVATAVGAGTATVIAELAAHAGVQAGASVRAISPEIPEDPDAESEVIIQSVTESGTTTPVNPDQVRGTVDVRMSVARGAADALQVHLVRPDGSTILLERCTQDFRRRDRHGHGRRSSRHAGADATGWHRGRRVLD
jgi:hypothetical protein